MRFFTRRPFLGFQDCCQYREYDQSFFTPFRGYFSDLVHRNLTMVIYFCESLAARNTFSYLQSRSIKLPRDCYSNPLVRRCPKQPHVIKRFCVTFARSIHSIRALYKINGRLIPINLNPTFKFMLQPFVFYHLYPSPISIVILTKTCTVCLTET